MSEHCFARPGRGVRRTRRRQPLRAAHTARLALALLLCTAALAQSPAQPLALESAIEAALDGPDVRLAQLQRAQAEAAAAIAGAAVSGSLRTGVQASWSNAPPEPGGSADLQPLSAQLTLNVVPRGPAFENAEGARAAAREATEALETAALQAAVRAAETWWTAERAHREAAQALARQETAARTLEATRVQVQAGTAGAGAAADAELALLQARLEAAAAATDQAAALTDLGQLIGVPVSAVAAREEDVPGTAAAWLAALQLPTEAGLRAAASTSDRVRNAERTLAEAVEATARAHRDAGPTASLSGDVSFSGEAGRASLAAGFDTRSYQPSLELSVDPWTARADATSASLSLSVTLPLGSARAAEVERADLAVALETERLASARAQAERELQAAGWAVEQAAGQLQLALDRLALRELQHQAVEVRAAAGSVSPLDLARSRRDLDDAGLALARSLDAARVAQAHLALALCQAPLAALGQDAAMRARFDALLEGVMQEVR